MGRGIPDPFSALAGSSAGFADRVPYYPFDCALTSMLHTAPGADINREMSAYPAPGREVEPIPVIMRGCISTYPISLYSHRQVLVRTGAPCPGLFNGSVYRQKGSRGVIAAVTMVIGVQVPELQVDPTPHTFPQAPQLFLSVR
jgi:hypothetical protein